MKASANRVWCRWREEGDYSGMSLQNSEKFSHLERRIAPAQVIYWPVTSAISWSVCCGFSKFECAILAPPTSLSKSSLGGPSGLRRSQFCLSLSLDLQIASDNDTRVSLVECARSPHEAQFNIETFDIQLWSVASLSATLPPSEAFPRRNLHSHIDALRW